MEEQSRAQELSVREISLIRELAQIRKEHKKELEYEKFDGYELPPRTQFSMLNKPAVSIKYGVMKFNIQFIQLLLEANGLAAGKDHLFFRSLKTLTVHPSVPFQKVHQVKLQLLQNLY